MGKVFVAMFGLNNMYIWTMKELYNYTHFVCHGFCLHAACLWMGEKSDTNKGQVQFHVKKSVKVF